MNGFGRSISTLFVQTTKHLEERTRGKDRNLEGESRTLSPKNYFMPQSEQREIQKGKEERLGGKGKIPCGVQSL